MNFKINLIFVTYLIILSFTSFDAFSAELESGPYISNPTLESSDTISIGKEVLFGATQSIVLKPGFTVSSGAFFKAKIGDFAGLTLETNTDNDGYADWWELLYYNDLTTMPDITPPVITLIGDSTITIARLDPYNDQGATAIDNIDGDLTAAIIFNDLVDTSQADTYIVSYDVSDLSGNQAQTVNRTVVVAPNFCDIETIPPVITLNGDTPVIITLGELYNEQGATAIDNCDGDLTGAIIVNGSVDTSQAGAYTLAYNATDSKGNIASPVYRTVIVGCQDVINIETIYNYDDGGRIERIEKTVY